ncbi:MAG: NADH-quinone oxidoreductase subunit NuoE family protein, partial [Planctomycetota bacterium]
NPLLVELEKMLGIGANMTTSDLEFTIQTVACFGSCALAPVVLINGKVHGRQTPKSVRKLVKALQPEKEVEESVK